MSQHAPQQCLPNLARKLETPPVATGLKDGSGTASNLCLRVWGGDSPQSLTPSLAHHKNGGGATAES